MSLFAIGDLHLSLTADKPMDVFGGRWVDYVNKIKKGFEAVVSDEDIVVLCGDISWGMSLDEALADFKFIDSLPGKKIILKGNHDYWWSTATAAKRLFSENDITTIDILNNNTFFYDNYAICGTRGWFFEEEKSDEHDKLVLNRECMRLESSLIGGEDKEKLVFLHYPPKYQGYECPQILNLIEKYNVKLCVYGHIHSKGCASAFLGEHNGTEFKLVSADYLNFIPMKIC